jgi:hypothetical protein
MTFEISGGPVSQLWYEVGEDYHRWLSQDRSDAAAIVMLPWAMTIGEDLVIESGITDELAHFLTHGVMPVLSAQCSSLKPIRIEGPRIGRRAERGGAVLTGLSNGVDSFSTASIHLDHAIPALRITHFSFHDVGSHGISHTAGVFEARRQRANRAAAHFGRPLVVVRTNASDFIATTFQQHHTLLNCSVAIALGSGVATYLYSSTVPYSEISVRSVVDISYADPVILPMLSTSGIRCVSANADLSRLQKTKLIADDPFVQANLDICVSPPPGGGNCSTCWKCCRTLLTLELLGKIELFRSTFNIEAYHSVRERYLVHLVRCAGPHRADLLALARALGAPIDTVGRNALAKLQSLIDPFVNLAPRGLRWRLQRALQRF